MPQQSGAPHDWLALPQVAELMGVSLRTVRRWEEEGLLTVARGRHRWTRRDWLDEFMVEPLARRRSWRRIVHALLTVVPALLAGVVIDELWNVDYHPVRILDIDFMVASLVVLAVAFGVDRLWNRPAPGTWSHPAAGRLEA